MGNKVKRWLAAILLVFVGLCLAVFAGLAWLGTTSTGLGVLSRAALSWVNQQPGWQLVLEKPSGSLHAGFSFEHIRWASDGLDIEAQQVSGTIGWAQLLNNRLLIQKLNIQRVQVRTQPKPEPEPFKLPKDLRPPLEITLQKAFVGELQVNAQSANHIHMVAHTKGGVLQLSELALHSQQAQVSATGRLQLAAPFQLQLQAQGSKTLQIWRFRPNWTRKAPWTAWVSMCRRRHSAKAPPDNCVPNNP
ncbi:MAG: hypothetical protein HC848_07715 [Limnobacter sp.]|nr:hypothetical protein [Limnobacter sp.]